MLHRVAARVETLSGWRRYGLAFLLGAAATLALPPLCLFPLLFLAFPPVVWMLAGAARRRAAFAVGWWFGFGYFAFGLYWIGNALLVFSDKFLWLLPFASAGLPAFLAFFTGAATWGAWYGRTPLQRALLFALTWMLAEWLRGHVLTGFPWNLIGYAWAGSDAMLQPAAIFGIYGLSLVAVLSACLPAGLAGSRNPRVLFATAVALPIAAWAGGSLRLGMAADTAPGDGIGLRVVQSDIPQREKWAPEFRERNLRLFLDLSLVQRPDWVRHVIWPETAATFLPGDNEPLRRVLAAAAPPGGLLITGAPRRIGGGRGLANAMIALDGAGHIVAAYDKHHLVPFGEYVPLADYLPIEKITPGRSGFTPGPGPQTLQLPGLPPFSPLICYEIIFPGAVVADGMRPDWLLNVTNDAWYGVSAGPHQHLAQSRVRAVEEGLPLVRASYTGISAVIDPYGRVLAKRGLNEAGVIDFRLPRALAEPPPYARWGDGPFGAMLCLVGIIVLLSARNNRKGKEQ